MMRQYELVERVQSYDPKADEALLNRAYVYAMKAHGNQKRASGEAYFSHPLEVAAILTELKLDDASIAVGLLISTVSRTQQEAFLGMILALLPAAILSGFLYPIKAMPQFFQAITIVNPLRHFIEIVRYIFLKGAGLAELWPQYIALTIIAAVVLSVATWRFRSTQRS